MAGTGGTGTLKQPGRNEDILAQDEAGQGEARGSIRYDKFKAGEFGEAVIRLGEASDLSTFLHEFGHLGHLILESIATDPEAPAEFKAMWENTLQWWGVSQEEWSALAPEAKVEHFERWARTFEAYLIEGKAPSLGLREAFAAFKEWLKRIYTSILRLDHNLNPEIRDVFDRMLATDAEMAEARAAQGADFALAREAFATEEEFAQYQQAISEARDAQEAELRARVMDAHARKSKRWWRGERERMRPAAARHVDSDPARRAEQWLGAGEWRPLPETTLSDEGETGYVAPADALEEMPEGLPEMRLSAEALAADWPDAQLPPAVAPRTDVEATLAEAMALKAVSKGRGPARAARLWLFIKNNGGVNLTGLSEERRAAFMAAIGSGQKRPGLINNKDGKTPEELMALAAQAGYFGKGAARELRQPPIDPSAPRAPEGGTTPDGGAGRGGRLPEQNAEQNRVQPDFVRNAGEVDWEAAGVRVGEVEEIKTESLNGPGVYRRLRLVSQDGAWAGRIEIREAPDAIYIDGLLGGSGSAERGAASRAVRAVIAEAERRGVPVIATNTGGATPGYWNRMGFRQDGQNHIIEPMRRGPNAPTASRVRAPEGGGELEQGGELFSDKAPSLEEFMAALTADLKNERQVYSAKDPEALASAQALADAQAWFDANEIDLTKPKEEIREQIVAALERGRVSHGTPPVRPGFRRWYHGGAPGDYDGKLWFTSSLQDAQGWASRAEGMNVWYVDIPETELRARFEDTLGDLPNGIAPLSRFEFPGDIASKRQVFREERVNVDAVHPDDAAGWFGFSSGDELVKALSALKPRAVAIEDRIDSMVEEEHGDAASPDKIQEASRLAAHVEAQSRRIEMELAALQKATGGRSRPVGRAARKYAEQQVSRMSVREVRGYEKFLAGERRAARNAADEAAKGNHGEAARQKSKQLVSFHLYRFARDATEEMDRAQTYFQKFDRATIRANIHAPLLDQIDQALEGIDLRRTPRISNRRRQNFLAWYAEMQAEGLDHMVAVDPAFLTEVKNRPFASLTVEEARGLRDAIKNFEHIGRRWREVLSSRGKRLMEEAVTEMVDAIDANGQIISEKRKGFSPDTLEYLNEQRLRFHAEHTKPEFLFRLLDGLKDSGPVWRNLFAPIARAEDAEMEMRNDAAARMTQVFSAYSRTERGRLFVKKRFITAIGRSMTKAEILSVALNWGNEGNRQALVEGYQWNDQQVRSILDELDQRDWQAVKDIWAWLEEYREPSFALQERLTGVRPAAVEGMEVATNFGPVQGAYYPLRYDPEQGERAFRREEQSKTLEEWGSNWIRPQTRQGHLQARVGSGGQKVRLDLSVLTEHVENVIHDITHREAVIGTLRFIENKRLQEAMIAAVGRQQYRQLRPWLSRIAADVKDPSTVWERVLLRLRMGASVVNMGWKITTAIVQPLGLLNSLPRVGGGALAKSLINFYAQPHKMREAVGFVFERSTFMKNRMATFDRDVRDALNRIRGKAERDAVPVGVRQSFFWMTGVMDMSVSVPTWIAAYDNAMSGKANNIAANDEKAAAEHADSVVRTTQGAGGVKDLTGYTGSKREIMRLFTMFYSYMSNLYNQLYVEQAGGLSGGIVPPHVFIGNMFVLWFLPAVGAIMLQGRWEPDDDETDEERLTRIGLEVAAYPLFTMVGVRDIVNGVITPYDYTMTPVSEALERTVGAGRRVVGAIDNDGAIDQDELRGILKDMTLATGYWLAIPARQLWITGEYLTDVATGEESPPWEDPEAAYEEGLLRDRR